MLGYVLGLWFRAAIVGICIYFLYHFFSAFLKYSKKRSNKSRGLWRIALLTFAYAFGYALGRTVGLIQCTIEAVAELFFKTKESD